MKRREKEELIYKLCEIERFQTLVEECEDVEYALKHSEIEDIDIEKIEEKKEELIKQILE